jgi:cell fate (sporulation/competence/biofilm development) regulator YlbF (YheA/YmcA/DUF963 family)
MNELILEKARELGEMIASSKEFQTMRSLEAEASSDQAISDLYAEYADLRDQLRSLSMENEPNGEAITALQSQVEAVEGKLGQQSKMKDLDLARKSFNVLMDGINRTLQSQLMEGDEASDYESACGSGGCEGCSGCGSR